MSTKPYTLLERFEARTLAKSTRENRLLSQAVSGANNRRSQ